MPYDGWMNLKKFILTVALFLFSSTVAVSDSVRDLSDSSYASTTHLLIYGLVGSSLLSSE